MADDLLQFIDKRRVVRDRSGLQHDVSRECNIEKSGSHDKNSFVERHLKQQMLTASAGCTVEMLLSERH
jgi:hypothetical protein